jgi:hypothetical protein
VSDEPVNLLGRQAVEYWLQDKPVEWAQAIAVRAALRVWPLVFAVSDSADEGDSLAMPDLVLQVSRAGFISWVARTYTTSDVTKFAVSADTSAASAARAFTNLASAARPSGASTNCNSAAYGAAYAARASSVGYSAAAYAADTVTASAGGSTTLWNALSADARRLIAIDDPSRLLQFPLWLSGKLIPDGQLLEPEGDSVPDWVCDMLASFEATVLVQKGDWGLWLDWYRALLPADPNKAPHSAFGQKADLEIATQPAQFWERDDPDAVMADIAKIVQKRRHSAIKRRGIKQFALDFIKGQSKPVSLFSIYNFFEDTGYGSTRASIRGRVNELTYEEKIFRLGRGIYTSNDSKEINSVEDATPQSASASFQFAEAVLSGENAYISQRPAAYQFHLVEGRIYARPFDADLNAEDAAYTFGALLEALSDLAQARRQTNSPLADYIGRRCDRLAAALGKSLEDVKSGALLAEWDTIEIALSRASSPEGQAELSPLIADLLKEVERHLSSLASMSPKVGEIVAARRVLNMSSEEGEALDSAHGQIVFVAELDKVGRFFDRSVLAALQAHEERILDAKEAGENASDFESKQVAQRKLDQLRALQLLDTANFGALVVETAEGAAASLSDDKAAQPFMSGVLRGARGKLSGEAVGETLGAGILDVVHRSPKVVLAVVFGSLLAAPFGALAGIVPLLFGAQARRLDKTREDAEGNAGDDDDTPPSK